MSIHVTVYGGRGLQEVREQLHSARLAGIDATGLRRLNGIERGYRCNYGQLAHM